jgi:hypothetical protein
VVAAARCGPPWGQTGALPLIALAELPIPAEARQRATELARWREEERQRRERRQLERADWRHEHTAEADTL